MIYFGGFLSKLGYFAGFSLHIINLAVRISAAWQGISHFFGCRIAFKGMMEWGEGRGILYLYIKASLVKWKDTRLWQPEFGPEENHFVSGNLPGFSLYISSERSAKLQWVGRLSHLGRGVAQ